MAKIKQALIILSLSALIFGCDLKTFGPGEVSERIMITDTEGNVIGGDLNNWQRDSVWLFEMLKPIYPNPSQNGKCTLYVKVFSTFRAKLEFDGEVTSEFYFPITGNPYPYIIDGHALNFHNQVKELKIYLNDRLYTSGYVQFD